MNPPCTLDVFPDEKISQSNEDVVGESSRTLRDILSQGNHTAVAKYIK
jgi:hypothetical protein